jgi:hypothetical protein
MTHLFADNGGTASTVKDTDFKEYYPSVNLNTSWQLVSRFAKTAARTYVIPFLGSGLYDHLSNPAITSPEKTELLDLVKSALAFYTIYDALPHMNTIISDVGVMEQSTDKAMPVQPWRFKATRWECMIKGDYLIDQALAYAEEHKDVFTMYDSVGTNLFPSMESMNKYMLIGGFRAFIRMNSYIIDAEMYVRVLLCGSVFDDLLADNLTDKEKSLLHLIRRYVADAAFLKAIPRLSIMIDGDGLKLLSSTDTFNLRSNALTTFGAQGPSAIVNHLKVDLLASKRAIQDFLMSNLDDFPDFKSTLPEEIESNMVFISPDCVGAVMI